VLASHLGLDQAGLERVFPGLDPSEHRSLALCSPDD
jgi:hypothetical protein